MNLELGSCCRPLHIPGMPNDTVLRLDLPGMRKVKSGKVREMFDLGDRLLLVATDRISAFDVVMPNGIPRKGEVLTQISFFWFNQFAALVPNHLLAAAKDPLPAKLQPYAAQLDRRCMIVRIRLEGVSQVPDRLRHPAATRPHRIGGASGAHFHAVDQGGGGAR